MKIMRAAETINLFIKTTENLTRLRYVKELNKPITVRIKFNNSQVTTFREGPEEESMRSFLLTLRLFCQDNERISIRNMANLIETLSLDPTLKSKFHERRKMMNDYLDSHSNPGFWINGDSLLTNRNIFDAFT